MTDNLTPPYEILPALEYLLTTGDVQPPDIQTARDDWQERFNDDKYQKILEAKEDE